MERTALAAMLGVMFGAMIVLAVIVVRGLIHWS
jgi:hypothetical protein